MSVSITLGCTIRESVSELLSIPFSSFPLCIVIVVVFLCSSSIIAFYMFSSFISIDFLIIL